MRHKINTLMVRSKFYIQHNELLFARNASEHHRLASQLETISDEIKVVVTLSRNLYPQGELSREKLFAIQRRQGVLKRKLADMKMRESEKMLERENCEREKHEIAAKRKLLLRKMDKFMHLNSIECRKRLMKDVRREESEIEERVSWQR